MRPTARGSWLAALVLSALIVWLTLTLTAPATVVVPPAVHVYQQDEPLDDPNPLTADTWARAGDIRVDCDDPRIWCDDEGS